MKMHHIGFLVSNLEEAIREFQLLNYEQLGEVIHDPDQAYSVCLMNNCEHILIELVMIDEGSILFDGMRRRIGSGPYHICYSCDDIGQAIIDLQKDGGFLLQAPRPSVAFSNQKFAFVMMPSTGLTELLEK